MCLLSFWILLQNVYLIFGIKSDNLHFSEFTNFSNSLRQHGTDSFSYDSNFFKIDGEPRYIFSGSIHYPRSTPSMWPRLADLSKKAGINMIQTYVFWNIHEPSPGKYDFTTGRKNLTMFLDVMQQAGLLVNLRIGPYVCAEWDLGGIPGWVRNVDGMECRTYNQPWMNLMYGFFQKTLEIVEPYLVRNGGPIVILQVENEYGNVGGFYQQHNAYVKWCATNVTQLEPDAIWIMCQQNNAPEPVIPACNGFTCDDWIAKYKRPTKPAMYTEDWPGWFTAWGKARLHRPVEDVLYSVISWFAKGGAHLNYYMWHGGTNWGRTAAQHFVQSYDYDTALNEFGFPYHRKYDALSEIHHLLDSLKWAGQSGKQTSCGSGVTLVQFKDSYVFLNPGSKNETVSKCASSVADTTVHARSAQIFLNKGEIVFDSAKIPTPWDPERKTWTTRLPGSPDIRMLQETIGLSNKRNSAIVSASKPMDQLLFNDTSDYLWYVADASSKEAITLHSSFEGTHVFVNTDDKLSYAGSCFPEDEKSSCTIQTSGTDGEIVFLSSMLGVQNYGNHYDEEERGLVGGIEIDGKSVTGFKHQNGLDGEYLNYASDSDIQWEKFEYQPDAKLVWYKIEMGPLSADPSQSESLAINLSDIGKGQAYINGNHIGRFWDRETPEDEKACKSCHWETGYKAEEMCGTGCGYITQSIYHIPNDWLSPHQNTVVIFTETGGDPRKVHFVTVHSNPN